MSKDQLIGCLILVASVVGIGIYAWLLYAYALIILQATAFIAVAAILGILAWIGYTMATTPPPTPIEDIEKGSEPLSERSKEESKAE
ncbi:MAG: transcriptional regulator [Candidatus Bathyarchaeia archaeon]